MAEKALETEDPFTIVGANDLGPMPDDAVEEMGRCFVEELARMGWGRERILHAFHHPFFQGPHLVYRRKGEAFVTSLVNDVFGVATERSERDG